MVKTYRIYGFFDGARRHRIAESFVPSYSLEFPDRERSIEVLCSDRTGTNDYVDIIVTAPTEYDCLEEVLGQESDGIFENHRSGAIFDLERGKEVHYDFLNEMKKGQVE